MQHRLVLLRHAQAADAPVDVDRRLTAEGDDQAAGIGRWLRDAGLVPDRVAVSPARRAVRTWQRAAAQLPARPTPIVEQRIYGNTVEGLLAVLRETPDDDSIVALVGHNPSIGTLASVLDDGQGSPSARRDLGSGFPTGAVAVFTLEIPFDAIAPGTGTLTAFAVPRA